MADFQLTEAKRKDFSDFLTVFVSTVGYPTYEQCMQHLRAQDCRFTLKIIDHVAPMNAAFQRMMNLCTTPYYVQVDEDMLLYPHAIRTLFERLSTMDGNVAQYVCPLYDAHLDRVIYGVKIFRHAIVRNYPFQDVSGCEWDQIRRFRADGYVDVRAPLDGANKTSEHTLGLHGTYWTPQAVYLRFSALERKRRLGNNTHAWVPDTAAMLLGRFLATRSEVDFYALMGVIAGSLWNGTRNAREKDYRTYERTPGLQSLAAFVEQVREGWNDGEIVRPDEQVIDVLTNSANCQRNEIRR